MDNIIIKVGGNILEADENIIAHQCNCVTKTGAGLSKLIYDKYPNSNIYINRVNADIPGTNKIIETNGKKIVNMLAQYKPGKPYGNENKIKRLNWFKSCLNNLDVDEGDKIAMPYLIGCGLAGGNWEEYYKLLSIWVKDKKIELVLYDINYESLKYKF